MIDDEHTKHHERRASDPLFKTRREATPTPIGMLTSADKLRAVAIEAVAREEACSLEEAALRLDTTPPVAAETPEQTAARRRMHENARIGRVVSDLGMPVRGELVTQLVKGECLRTRATHEAAEWMRSDKRVLVLIGDVGVGKTVAACLVACAFARRRKSTRYLREPALVRWWHSSTLAHESQIERLRDADLVIVDELGTTLSGNGERARDATGGLVDDRIAGDVRTVLIGNLSIDGLSKAYGARFADRLVEIGRVVHLTGESMRGRS